MAGEDVIICPNCEEANPAAAVMCWACYTPLRTPRGIGAWLQARGIRFSTSRAVLPDGSDEKSVVRIVNTILMYAVRDHADQVVVETYRLPGKGDRIGIHVFYCINGQWHEQMRLPGYVWEPMARNMRERFHDQSTFQADAQLQSFLEDVLQSGQSKNGITARTVKISAKISADSGEKITLVLNCI